MTPDMKARYHGVHPCEMLAALKELKGIVSSGDMHRLDDDAFGICYNLNQILWTKDCHGDVYAFVDTNAYGWPEHRTGQTGEPYPVPYVKGYDNWEGPNLEARLSLIDWLINVCVVDLESLRSELI